MKTKTRITAGIAVAAFVLTGGAATVAVASPDGADSNHSTGQKPVKPVAPPAVSQDQAVQTALSNSPGATLEKAELEARDNYWSIDLQLPGTAPAQHVDYKVNATTGAVIKVERDTQHRTQAPAAPAAPAVVAPAAPTAVAAAAPAAPAVVAPEAKARPKLPEPAAEKAKEQAHDAKEKAAGDD